MHSEIVRVIKKKELPRWYLMTHHEMKRFKDWLEAVNALRFGNGAPIIESFFPGEFLRGRRTSTQEVTPAERDRDEIAPPPVSADFQHLVFLKSTRSELNEFVHDKWNTDFRARLMYYLDPEGKPATVSDQVMQDFFESCLQYRGRFELCPSIEGIEKMDKVEILSGPFAGYRAAVVEVHHAKGEIHLRLALELVAGVMNIEMRDVTPSQVVILDREKTDLIRTDFIKYTQNHLLPILYRRMKRTGDEPSRRRDAAMLSRLYHYRHHQVENESARLHFLALMLICAHLIRDEKGEAQLQAQTLQALAAIDARGEALAATDTRTYLWIALYIATGDARYRDAAKQYVQQHHPKSDKLTKFVAIIRRTNKL